MTPAVATIGTFDGMHLGHQHLAARLLDEARSRGGRAMVFTFGNHPRQAPLLMPVAEKVGWLERMGIEVSVLDFTPELKSMSAGDFMARLAGEYGVTTLLMGFNNHFGHDRPDRFEGYVELGARLGIDVVPVTEVLLSGVERGVSSSAIRRLLVECRPEEAWAMLGRPYKVGGIVAHGKEVGRTIGFPTANVEPLCGEQLIPGRGVYAARVRLLSGNGAVYPAMLNVGHRPTVDVKGAPVSIEAHLLGGFAGQIYGCDVEVEFLKYLRPERRFDSLDGLKRQLTDDARRVTTLFASGAFGPDATPCRLPEK